LPIRVSGVLCTTKICIWEGCQVVIKRASDQLTLLEIVLDGNGYSITVNLWTLLIILLEQVRYICN
jgi:hypothetical protein